jgi:hypothetical protein
VLVDHADARLHGITGSGEVLRDVVEQDLAFFGVIQPVEDVHQGRLAGAVLPEQGVDLTGLHDQVDRVVGDQVTEALGDSAQFELHCSPSFHPRPVDEKGPERRIGETGEPVSPSVLADCLRVEVRGDLDVTRDDRRLDGVELSLQR